MRFGGLWHQQCNVEENVLEQKNMSDSLAQYNSFFAPVCSLTRFKGVFDPNVVIII